MPLKKNKTISSMMTTNFKQLSSAQEQHNQAIACSNNTHHITPSPSPPEVTKNSLKNKITSTLFDTFECQESMPTNKTKAMKSKLHDLFTQIENEFDLLLTENIRLTRIAKGNDSNEENIPSIKLTYNKSRVNFESLTKTVNQSQISTTSCLASQKSKAALFASKSRINNLSFPKFKPNARELMKSIKNTSAQIVNKNQSSGLQSKLQCNLTGHMDGIWDINVQSVPNHLINNKSNQQNSSLLIGTASADTTARLWYLNSQTEQTFQLSSPSRNSSQITTSGFCVQQYCGHSGSVNSIRFHPRFFTDATNLILTGSGDAEAHIWQSVLSSVSNSLEATSDVVLNYNSCYSITKGLLSNRTSVSNNIITPNQSQQNSNLIDLASNISTIRSPIKRFQAHTDAIIAAEWFPDGDLIATGSWDRSANIFNVETGKILCNLQHDDALTNLKIHKSQKIVLTSSKDCTFKLWDFRDPICSVNVYQGHIRSVNSAIFVDQDKIATSSDDQTLKLWDLRIMRSPLFTINCNSGVNRICTMNTPAGLDLPSETLLCLPLDNRDIKIYNLQGERALRLPRTNHIGHKRIVTSLANSGNFLLSASFDKQINCWSLDSNTVKTSKIKENDQLVSNLCDQQNGPNSISSPQGIVALK